MSFDPLTKEYVFTRHQPVFTTNDVIYASGGWYGAGEFDLVDMKKDKHFSFEATWDINGSYWEGNSIFLKFSGDGQKKKYLRISY